MRGFNKQQGMECKQVGADNKHVGGLGVNDNSKGPDFQRFGCFVDPRHVSKHSFYSGLNKIWLRLSQTQLKD